MKALSDAVTLADAESGAKWAARATSAVPTTAVGCRGPAGPVLVVVDVARRERRPMGTALGGAREFEASWPNARGRADDVMVGLTG